MLQTTIKVTKFKGVDYLVLQTYDLRSNFRTLIPAGNGHHTMPDQVATNLPKMRNRVNTEEIHKADIKFLCGLFGGEPVIYGHSFPPKIYSIDE